MGSRPKLRLDFGAPPSMVWGMAERNPDDHTRELIQGLCLEAGRIMEDTSAELALVLPVSSELVIQRVGRLQRAAEDIAALAGAATALVRGAS